MDTHKSGRGFFSINRHAWKLLCGLGDINAVAIYLAIACGTGKDNRFSFWSGQAIEKYVGINRTRAKRTVKQLIEWGFISTTEKHTRLKPHYEVRPLSAPLQLAQSKIPHIEKIVAPRKGPRRSKQIAATEILSLRMRGLIWDIGGQLQLTPPEVNEELGESDLIWLPNTLVTGTVAAEPSPVRRLRMVRELPALRLLIDLYHQQNLLTDGGIDRHVIRQSYKRARVGEYGRYIVWGFSETDGGSVNLSTATETFWLHAQFSNTHTTEFWAAANTLIRMRLLEEFIQLSETDDLNAEIIHSLAKHGETFEAEVANAAYRAALRCLGPDLASIIATEVDYLVPVDAEYQGIHAIGVFRLKYRPQTARTAAWAKNAREISREWIEKYNSIAGERNDIDIDD